MRIAMLSAAAAVLLSVSAAAGHDVWWEGEKPEATNFPARTSFSAGTFESARHEILSGGDWLTNEGPRRGSEAFARWRVEVPADATYNLWARKFWKHGPFRWRFDNGPWQECGRDVALADTVPIRKFLCVNWVPLGEVRLTRGTHAFEIRLLAGEGEALTACFDAFLLTDGVFVPRGCLKPGETSGRTEPGWWALEPAADPFADSPLDLRGLNEATAGASGFVRRDGERFLLGDGTPVRFWGVNCGGGIARLDAASQRYLARRLAKVGVNIVRVHSAVFDRRADDPKTLDREYLDGLHRFVAALKAEGIYVALSFCFPLWFDVKPSDGLPGYETIQNKKPFALLFFDPQMQEIYRTWARGLLETPNPYTGLPLARDPAVALVEILNEDSYFFWTFSSKNIPRPQMEKLEAQFGAWLAGRYGSAAKALAAWGEGAGQSGDAPAEGRMAVLDVWNLTARGHGTGAKSRRMSDQLRFLTEQQKAFYEATVRFFRQDLHVGSLVTCSNWQTADATVLDPLERYTYTAGDCMDRHGYFGGRHEGPRAAYALDEGDAFEDRAAVRNPGDLPFQFLQVGGHPQIISEIGWTNPNRFKAECPVLCAAYGSLQGADGFFFFAVGGPTWSSAPEKFPVMAPTVLGQFPATALAYRRGDVREGPVLVREALRLEDLYAFKGSAVVAAPALDKLRQSDAPTASAGQVPQTVDPFAFYVGRVTRSFDDGQSVFQDLEPYVRRNDRRVRAATGELEWDYGRGLVTINTPRTQGATGFLAQAGRIELADVAIESANEFASILVVSLNAEPIASSRRILVQAMTEEKPFGWRAEGGRIAALGGYPMLVRNVDASVVVRGGGPAQAQALDPHGYARGLPRMLDAVRTDKIGDGVRLRLAPDAIYTVIERRGGPGGEP